MWVRGFIVYQEKNILISRCVKIKPTLPVSHLVCVRNLAHIPYKMHLYAHTSSEAVLVSLCSHKYGFLPSRRQEDGWKEPQLGGFCKVERK